jgi:hypothetical protein
MAPLIMIRFADVSGGRIWRAFSSTDEDRPWYKLRREVFYEIGFQESYPADRNTTYGELEHYHPVESAIQLHERMDGLQLVQTDEYEWVNDFPIIKMNQSYTQPIPSDFSVCQMIHTFIEPNPYYDNIMDSDSDSDSS